MNANSINIERQEDGTVEVEFKVGRNVRVEAILSGGNIIGLDTYNSKREPTQEESDFIDAFLGDLAQQNAAGTIQES